MEREEAMKILRAIYNNALFSVREALETLIPELAGSEDERIRKGLIEALKTSKTVGELKFILPESTREECIAWLERQKMLFKSGRGLYYYDGEKTAYCGYPATEENPYDFAMSQQEKQQEQKPKRERNKPKESWLEKSKYELAHEEELLIKRQKELSEIRALKDKEQKPWKVGANAYFTLEQKPVEPSDEELQRHQDELYGFKVFAARQAREHHISFVYDFEWNNFCAELLSYFNEKQKPAWSEEDETMLRTIISDGSRGIELDSKQISWLKSLRPSWRPSEEQMNALLNAEGYLREGDQFDSAKSIAKLYEQLKKLM